jgi:ketosteroid isomerase-like protein
MAYSNNFEVIRNLYSAYEKADLEAFYKDLSPDIVWRESDGFPTPGVFRSKTEIVDNVFSVLERDWSSWSFALDYLVDGNEHVVAVGTYRGTHRKTGKHFESRASHMWHLLNGKIGSFEQFADTHLMQTAATASSTSA